MKKILLVLFSLILVGGCAKKEETVVVPKTGIELVAVGPINFGGVLVGENRDAAIRVFNYGPNELNTSALADKLVAPFKVQSISAPCNGGKLPVGSNCTIAIRFSPTEAGSFSQDFVLDNATIKPSGRGLLGGVLDISETLWDVGTTIAGVENRKTFTFNNLGDFTIPAPNVTLVQGVTIGFNTCGSYIPSRQTCRIELVARKTIKGDYNEMVVFNAQEGGILNVNLINSVRPSEASGVIAFSNAPTTIAADGATEHSVTTLQIKDQFGNVVEDGTNIRLSGSNVTILTSSPQATVNGVISFIFKAPQTKGFSTISLLSGDASGFLRALATSGPPAGTIQVQTYTNEIVANGQAQTLFKLLPLQDQFGNVVEDGTPVYYFIEGGGTISAPISHTLLGTTQMSVTAPALAGNATFKIRAGPIYDESNNVVGWRASGDFPLKYIPGLASGVIPMTASHPSIYATEDQTIEDLGLPIRTTIVVGPVRDAFGNLVAPNSPLTLTLNGGKNITYQNQNPVTLLTDNNGNVSFMVAGDGLRGEIKAVVTSASGARGEQIIWAFSQERLTPSNNPLINKFTIYEGFDSALALPSYSRKWGVFGSGDSSFFTVNDGIYFNRQYKNVNSISLWLNNIDFLRYPCFFSNKNYLQQGFCQRDEFVDVPSFRYNALVSSNPEIDSGPVPPLTFSTRHNPGDRDGWQEYYREPRYPMAGYIPATDTYLLFGGLFYDDVLQHRCDRITLATHPTNANSVCNDFSSCSWNNTTQRCVFKSDTTFIGNDSDWTSYFFNMGNSAQSTSTSFAYGGMGFDQVGDYPPATANVSSVTNDKDLLFTFGGFKSNIPDGNGTNQVYIFNGNTRKWTSVYPEPDPNERGINAEPSVRYQNGIGYVPETNKLYVAGGLRKFYCEESLSKNSCNQYPGCGWNDYEAIDCSSITSAGQNCYERLGQSDLKIGEFCEPVSQSKCRDIDVGFPPYNAPGSALAASECNKRSSCQWDDINLKCNIKNGANNGGEGWTDAKDVWELDLTPMGDDDDMSQPVWKKLCDSQEPFLKGTNTPNPAYRSCGLPAGSIGSPVIYQNFALNKKTIDPVRTNMTWNPMKSKMYFSWSNNANVLEFDPFNSSFAIPSGPALGLANSYQVIYNSYSGKTFSYKRGIQNQLNSSLHVWETVPDEKYYLRASVDVGVGAKSFARKVKPVVRGAGRVTGTAPASGIVVYIYNHDQQEWVVVGTNNNVSTTISSFDSSEISAEYNDAQAREFISPQGKIDLLITPNGSPALNGTHSLSIDSIAMEGQF